MKRENMRQGTEQLKQKREEFSRILLTAVAFLCLVAGATKARAADDTPQKVQPVVITTEQSVKKTGSLQSSLDVFIVPVLAVGSGKCKATAALADPLDGEFISIFCLGACYGPYSVVDANTGYSSYSVSTTVSVETYGILCVLATAVGPAENFPKKLAVTIQF